MFASRFKNKPDLGLVFVNEKEDPAKLTIATGSNKRQLKAWVLTGASLNSTQVSFNGKPGPKGGGGPFPIDSLTPYTKNQDGKDSIELTVPPASLVGVVLTD